MDNENKFWLATTAILSTAVVLIVFLSTAYWEDHNSKLVEMVNNGVAPEAAMCALQDDYGNHPVCIVLAAKAK